MTKEELNEFFDELKKLKKETITKRQEHINDKKMYDVCCELSKTNNCFYVNEIKLREKLNTSYDEIVNLFNVVLNNYMVKMVDTKTDNSDVKDVDANMFVKELVNLINQLDSPLLNITNKYQAESSINKIYDMIIKTLNNTCTHIINLTNLYTMLDVITNDFSKSLKKEINISENDLMAFKTLVNEYFNDEKLADRLVNNINKYNNVVKEKEFIDKYLKLLTKTKLENLTNDMFPKTTDELYIILRNEIEKLFQKKGKYEYLLPLLDINHYRYKQIAENECIKK